MKYKQELPDDVVKKLDAYVERIKAIKWFTPSADLKKEKVETAVKVSLKAFGVEAKIEFKQLKTTEDWDAAWDAARDAARDAAWDAARDAARDAAWDAARGAAWDAARDAAWGAAWGAARDAARDAAWGAAWDAARGAAETLVEDLKEYKGKKAFLSLEDIWEMGLYPIGVVDGVFIIYVPASKQEFPEDLK